MKTSEKVSKIVAVMLAVQASVEPVGKDKQVKVGGNANWESGYASLGALAEVASKALRAHGVLMTQTSEETPKGERLVTRVSIEDEWMECEFPIKPSRDGAQGYGGGLTFARRWTICCLFGLVPGDLEEAQGYRDNRAPKMTKASKRAPNIADALEALRSADTSTTFAEAARAARAAYPTGEQAGAVEREITAWFGREVARAADMDVVTCLKDLANKVRPRGNEAREAFRLAEARLGVPS